MSAVLFPADSTVFQSQGLGSLVDMVSGSVHEVLNGEYELEMQYPISGARYADLQNRCIIYAKHDPYNSPQPFRVYRITRPIDGIVTVYARHLAYDLSGVPVGAFSASNAPAALQGLSSNSLTDNPFTFWTDLATNASFSTTIPQSCRSLLGGQDGSVLDVYGGEYEWDNWTVKLRSRRGSDNGVRIVYGKNLTDIEQDENIENVKTGIIPYWADTQTGAVVYASPQIVPAPGTYSFSAVVPVDFSSQFQEQPTPEDLYSAGQSYVSSNQVGVPTVSISLSFAQLEQYSLYESTAQLEKVTMGDTVTVYFGQLGVNASARIVETDYDIKLDRYNSVTVGSVRANIATTIADQQQEIAKAPTTSAMMAAISAATALITGALGGNLIITQNPDGTPNGWAILIGGTTTETATAVWRMNSGGLGYSSNGWNGPYSTAITADGAIVADFLTVGTLNAAMVHIINLIADHVLSQNGNITTSIWAASIDMTKKIGDDTFNRVNIFLDAQDYGYVKVSQGDVTGLSPSGGGLGTNGKMTTIAPESSYFGQQNDGSCSGTINTGSVNATGNISAGGTVNAQSVSFLPGGTIVINGLPGTVAQDTVENVDGERINVLRLI